MVGKDDMTLYGWRQLIEWSLEHACLTQRELTNIKVRWGEKWDIFLNWVVQTYEKVPRDGKL